jgi:membrane-bound lytic murein transglycosylase D
VAGESDARMMTRRRVLFVAVVCAALGAAACRGASAPVPPVVAPTPPPVAEAPDPAPVSPPLPDPADELIARSHGHFQAGERELQLGHLERARAQFNQALDVLLEWPAGARSTPKLQEHFDHLVDRISAYEIRALALGDGFAEQPEQPASLDQLLALSTADLPAPKPELRTAVELDLKSTAHDLPIPLNGKVLAYIELFQGRLRDWFQAALQRGQAYMPMIQSALRAEGLPLDLAFVPIVESAFHANALSRAKARGFWQLMRGTAVEQGLKHDWYIDERSNPDKATVAAVKYFRVLNRMFNGDWHLTLASYNGGPGTVQRAVRRRGVADFWTLAAKGRYLPRETREYVPMVLAAIVVARNPAQYGFTTEPALPPSFETVPLPGPVDLRRIAEWAGVAVDDIQRLNPELRRLTTPLRSEGFQLRVPPGTAEPVAAQLAGAPPEYLAALQYHTVKRGESIATIATKLRVRRTDLAEANYLGTRARVKPGDRLVIPRAPTALLAARADGAAQPVVAVQNPAPGEPDAGTQARAKVTYRVRKGDTLYSIARSYGTTVELIREWNGLKGSRINPGDRLTLYASRDVGGQRP